MKTAFVVKISNVEDSDQVIKVYSTREKAEEAFDGVLKETQEEWLNQIEGEDEPLSAYMDDRRPEGEWLVTFDYEDFSEHVSLVEVPYDAE